MILFAACSTPKAYYETKEGKRKQKYYNDIQYVNRNIITIFSTAATRIRK